MGNEKTVRKTFKCEGTLGCSCAGRLLWVRNVGDCEPGGVPEVPRKWLGGILFAKIKWSLFRRINLRVRVMK